MVVGAPRRASAGELGIRHLGVRGGVSMNPDQFHGGVFLDAGRLASSLRFQPSFEFGVGNGVRLGAANADVLYPLAERSWLPYAGAGLGVNFVDVTNGVGEGNGLEIKPVFNVVGGVEWGVSKQGSRAPRRYVIEARLGIGDTPDFKIGAGVIF